MVEKSGSRGTHNRVNATNCPVCSGPVSIGQRKCAQCGVQLYNTSSQSPATHQTGIRTQPTSGSLNQSKLQTQTKIPQPVKQQTTTPSESKEPKPTAKEETKKVQKIKKQGYWGKLDRSEIRRIKIYLFVIQIVLLIIIILNAMYESMIIDSEKLYLSMGFYLPIGYLIFFILFLIFLISVEGLWFKFVHMRNSRSFEKRSKLIKNYQYTAQWVLVTAIIVIIILLSLIFLPFISDMLKTENEFEVSPNGGEEDNRFEEQDAFGLTHTSSLSFSSNESVFLELDTKELSRDIEANEIKYNKLGNYSSKELTLSDTDFQLGYTPNKKYYFFIKNIGNQSISGKYTINREISKPFIFNIIFFMILFVITSAIWLAYLSVIKRKYEKLHNVRVAELTKRYAVKPYTIEDVFLIHKDGTLISHQTRRLKPMDNDILSAMLTAIKDFIKDAFKSDSKGELNELKYGKLKIYIEHSQFAFLAVVISGTPPKNIRLRMKQLLGEINRQYYNELKIFSGIPKKFENVKGLILQHLISKEEDGTRFDEGSDSFWNNKGVVQTKVGKYHEALQCFDRALKLNPGVSNIWLNRGIALVKLNEFEEAMDCFDRALQLDPNNETAKHRRNKCWYKWKLLEAREGYITGSVTHRRHAPPPTSDYGYDQGAGDYYDYPPEPAPTTEYVAGGPSYGSSPGPAIGLGGETAGSSNGTGYYEEPTSTAPTNEEPPPRCPNCGQPLRFVEEYESWYCDPCDSYPFDD
jgi:tetratricopeptide (TPR) repeat protein